MSSRLAFQTQLASIMEVLANAAVAEICKLVDDDYAVVSLQMSQCQRENKGLKRKLNLLELKMARGYAERRLRESAMNSRPNSRVHINTNEKFRGSSSSTGGVYDIQLDHLGMWSGGPGASNDHNSSQMHPNPIRDKSPDLQLVEPESLLVKEERMEDPLGDAEADDVPLIGEDGVVECGPRGGSNRTGPGDSTYHPPTSAHGPEQLSQPQHPEQQQGPRNRHRVESAAVEDRDPDILLIKVENLDPRGGGLSIQEGPEESSRDDYRGGALPLEATHHNSPPDHTHHHPGPTRHHTTEVSYGRVSYESHPLPLWTNGGSGGCGDASVPGPSSLNLSYPAGPGMLIMGGRMGPAGSEMGQHRGFTVESSGSFSGSREGSEMAGYDVGMGGSDEAQGGQETYKCGRKKVVRKKAYLCKFCGKGFSSPANLEPHLRTHTGERPFGCTVCGKHFSQYWNLKIHKNVHTGERPYACPLCGERFADPSNLKKHQKRHHPQQ